ncbi:metallophosphoesterase [Paenibacillus nasutitermitis]|uniref:Metallophosphoesterase n=1 Tax=Paenibacillus nasutitermitis TaxID=1652958 RepID=A0A916Z006_9BACL|nr:metallophosphoesterase [Paenibacillus nasutitermitis]GGD69429.1 metallophosphoesterase [Paenibacillus nasutitermitis]
MSGWLLALIFVAVGMLVYMRWEAYRYQLDQHEITLVRLPEAFDGTRLLFISDIHRRVIPEAVVEQCREAGGADLVLIGGDLREKGVPLERVRSNLRKLAALAPVYFVYGNHDHDEDIRPFEVMLVEERVHLLVNESVTFAKKDGSRIRLAGVDDPRTNRDKLAVTLSEPEDGNKLFTLLLAHDPLIAGRLLPSVPIDLILSGHTHGGQIVLPLFGPLLKTKSLHAYGRGWFKLPASPPERPVSPLLFVSCGFGTSKFPLRLLAPAQFHLLTLKSDPHPDQSSGDQ